MLPELSIIDNGNGLTGQQIYECSRSCVREERLSEIFGRDGVAADWALMSATAISSTTPVAAATWIAQYDRCV
jgi:hypothetical protein